jgi:hypothetical protein
MPRTARVIDIFIASPGDAKTEREIITALIHQWNATHYGRGDVILHPIRWESHSHPSLEGRPQSIITRKLLSHADMLIALFKGRLGKDTGEYESGTIEEIEECRHAGIPILLYFYDVPPAPPEFSLSSWIYGEHTRSQQRHAKDMADFDQVRRYRARYESHGIVGAYRTIEEFEKLMSFHLDQAISEFLSNRIPGKSGNKESDE